MRVLQLDLIVADVHLVLHDANERTKVDVSADHFDIANQQYVPPPKPYNPLLAMKGQYQAIKTHQKEDKEAKIEILSNMKLFLLEKVS